MPPHSNDETQQICLPEGFLDEVRRLFPEGTDLNLDSALKRAQLMRIYSVLQQKLTQNMPASEIAWCVSELRRQLERAHTGQVAPLLSKEEQERLDRRMGRFIEHYARIEAITRLTEQLINCTPGFGGHQQRR